MQKKQYAKDALSRNKSYIGDLYDRYSGAHKIQADIDYGRASNAKNRAAAEQYLKSKGATNVKMHAKKVSKKAKNVVKRNANKSVSSIPTSTVSIGLQMAKRMYDNQRVMGTVGNFFD